MLTRNRKAARKSLMLPRAAVWFLSQCRPEIYPYTTYMRFFVPRLLLRNTATGFAYCPIGQYGYGLRLLPYRAKRLRCYAIAPGKGQYAPRFGYWAAPNTPHKSIHCDPIPKSINTLQFPTQMFAFSDSFQ